MKQSGYFTTSSVSIYYERYGSGTPLLLLHGNSQSLTVFHPFLRAFLPDFQVILMDSRGHGRSQLSARTQLSRFSTEDMADDVIALLDHLHLPAVHLLGFSDGANIGLEIACKYPSRLRSLICLSANASPKGLLTPLYLAAQIQHALLNHLGNLLLIIKQRSTTPPAFPTMNGNHRHTRSRFPHSALPVMKDNTLKLPFGRFSFRISGQKKKSDFLGRLTHRVFRRRNLTSLLLHSPHLSAQKLHTISIPVLLIAGTRDLIKTSHSRWLSRQIPTSQLLLMTGGRHTSFFRKPAPYLRAIFTFLRSQRTTSAIE